MKLLYFLNVLLFFQNVKFCSRTIPVFLYVRLFHVSGGKLSHFDMIENSLMISMRAVEYWLPV